MEHNILEPYVSAGHLNVPAGLMFTIQPFNQTVRRPGEVITLRAVALNAEGYVWLWWDPETGDWTDTGVTDDTFTVEVTAGMDGWKFCCAAFDEDDNYILSRAAVISIRDTVEISDSGAIVTIDNGPVTIKSLKVDIEPYQVGTGDPSSENVRPISGYDSVTVVNTPEPKWVQLWDIDSDFNGSIEWNQLVPNAEKDFTSTTTDTRTYLQLMFRLNTSPYTSFLTKNIGVVGVYSTIVKATANGNAHIIHSGLQNNLTFVNNIPVINDHAYLLTLNFTGVDLSTVGGVAAQNIQVMDLTQMFGTTIADYIYSLEHNTAGAGVTFFKNLYPNDYYPYNAGTEELVGGDNKQTYSISLGQTVYSGYLDVTNGKLYSCPYYASYDGEELTGHWISDRDVYAEGTTPTTGAQVVNDGGTLTETEIDPVTITTLFGDNNIYADCGDIEITYKDWPAAEDESDLLNLSPLNIPDITLDIDDELTPDIGDELTPAIEEPGIQEFDTLL